jgi:hypothetical protein
MESIVFQGALACRNQLCSGEHCHEQSICVPPEVPAISFTLLFIDAIKWPARIAGTLLDLATCFTKSQMHTLFQTKDCLCSTIRHIRTDWKTAAGSRRCTELHRVITRLAHVFKAQLHTHSLRTSEHLFYMLLKVKFTLEQAMKAQRGSRSVALLFLISPLSWGWVIAVTPQPLYPQERPGTHCIGGCVVLRAGLDGYRISCPHQDLIPRLSSP